MGQTLAYCLEQVSPRFDYGILAQNPIMGNCQFTSENVSYFREKNYARFLNPQCFSYAYALYGDVITGSIYDVYVKQSKLETDLTKSMVQLQIQNRLGASIFDESFNMMSNIYDCVAERHEPASGNSYLPCTRS